MPEHRIEIISGINEGKYGWVCACNTQSGLVYPTREAAEVAGEDHRTMTPPSGA